MAITTDSTQRTAGQPRADSSTVDSQAPSRTLRDRLTSSVSRDSSIAPVSSERPLADPDLLRITHESVMPDRQSATAADIKRRIAPAEFNTAMSHFYRGEVQRSNVWRTRLDTTTYWAVFTSAATLSFSFSSATTRTSLYLSTRFWWPSFW